MHGEEAESASATRREDDLAQLLDAPIAALEKLGLGRPETLTVARHLALLGETGLLPAAATASYLQAYQRCMHGAAVVPADEIRDATAALLDALRRAQGDEPLLTRARAALHSASNVGPPLPPARSPVPSALRVNDLDLPPPAPDQLDEETPALASRAAPSKPWYRRWTTLTAFLCAYSAIMVAVGHLNTELIDRALEEVGYRVFGGVRPGDEHGFRNRAAANPGDIRAWQEWARHAERRGHWAEAMVAHRHVVARRPDDAGALNAFAWFLCTADAAWARDPVQALELAERAYALDQSPAITDTLAEAAFQNGDVARAVALEEDAIRRLQGNDEFYRRQLRKFRSALAPN